MPRNLQVLGDLAALRMCVPMSNAEAARGGCKPQMLFKTMLTISPTKQEVIGDSGCQHSAPGCSSSMPRWLDLCAQPVEVA